MGQIKNYAILLSGLKEGQHIFDFEVGAGFFELFESSELTEGDINVRIVLHKNPNLLMLQIDLEGILLVKCDRCLDDFMLPVENEATVVVKFEENEEYEDHDIFVIRKSEDELNVAQLIYDYIILSVPYQCVHPLDENGKSTCDPEMIQRLEKYLVENEDQETDPRWDELKKLLN